MKSIALVTGASNGIGLEFSRLLAKEGHDLVVIARSSDKLNELKAELEKKYSIKVFVMVKDLSEANAAEWVYAETKKLNLEISILINNAGFGDFGHFIETKVQKEEQMIALNITTLTKLTKFYAQDMVKRKNGKILNVASTAAFQAGPMMAVYFATKAYVLSFTEAIATELKDSGVTVTALCPGPTATGFIETAEIQNQKIFQLDKFMPSSNQVATFGLESMGKGKIIAVHGFINFLGTLYAKFLPRNFVAATFRFLISRQ